MCRVFPRSFSSFAARRSSASLASHREKSFCPASTVLSPRSSKTAAATNLSAAKRPLRLCGRIRCVTAQFLVLPLLPRRFVPIYGKENDRDERIGQGKLRRGEKSEAGRDASRRDFISMNDPDKGE